MTVCALLPNHSAASTYRSVFGNENWRQKFEFHSPAEIRPTVKRLHNQSQMPFTALFMSVTFDWRKLLKTILSLRVVYLSIAYCFYRDLASGVATRCLPSLTWRKIKVQLPTCVQKYFNRIFISNIETFWIFLFFSLNKKAWSFSGSWSHLKSTVFADSGQKPLTCSPFVSSSLKFNRTSSNHVSYS